MTTTLPAAELVLASHAQQAQRWRLHHDAWGDGMALPLYLRREESLHDAELCKTALRMWLLVGDTGQVLASCETYASTMVYTDGQSPPARLRAETVASVLVEPGLRQLGHAARLMQLLRDELAFEGVSALTLYSDVGPQLYRKSGFYLHQARESVAQVHPGAWPDAATPIGLGGVADLLHAEAERVPQWLGAALAPAVGETPAVERVAWFHLRSQYRAWARDRQLEPSVGARGPDGGWMLWTCDAAEPVLHALLWRPETPADAAALTQAALAYAAEQGLERVTWWDADRDTGLDPYRQPHLQPTGALARTRDKALPMLAWLEKGRPMPIVWMGIERIGWA